MARRKIIYIGGWGRSGSSLLANVLGSHAEAASFGELRYIWDRAILENKLCGCGSAFRDCAFWQVALERARLPEEADFAASQQHGVGSKATFRQLRAMLTGSVARYHEKNADRLAQLRSLYTAAADEAAVDVIVDASKTPPYAINLLGDEFEVYFVHLVRDPRAVAYSWSRKLQTKEAQGEYLPRYSSLKSSAYWGVFNLLGLWFRRYREANYLRIRYEDFCRQPRQTIEKILAHCGMSPAGLSWHGDHCVDVTVQHSISGNPSRFNVGAVEIRPDIEWCRHMAPVSRRLVTLCSAPLLRMFGYPLSVRNDSTDP